MIIVKVSRRILPVVVVLCAFLLGLALAPDTGVTAQDVVTLNKNEQILTKIYETVSPSVVSINSDQRFGREIFQTVSSGSGFVIDTDGHIVTNFHVVDSSDRIVINFFDGTIVRAELIGGDADSDLAVVKVDVDAEFLVPVAFGDSSALAIGQTALAIGSPFGQRWTMTQGIISALDRTIQGLSQFSVGSVIQTDTPINPGNSGGPLINLLGEVIGVNSQILSEERAFSGVGFAVPSNLVQRVARELINNGEVDYSYLGIQGDDINIDYIEAYSLPNNLRGVLITYLEPGGPAARGGILADTADIVVSIDGTPITGFDSLVAHLANNTLPGQLVTLRVLREGDYVDLEVILGSRLNR